MANPVMLSSVNSNVLPRTISEPIFNRTLEESAVMRLARRLPLSMTGNTMVPVSMDVPLAGWVAEAGAKRVGSSSIGVKQMAGKKVAVLVPVSQEVAMTNAGGLYDQLVQDLPKSIARAFDYAAIHGQSIIDNTAGPFAECLADTTNDIELGTAAQNVGGIWKDIVDGEALIVGENYDVTGFVGDPRVKPLLKLSVDSTGRPLFVDDLAGAGVAGGGYLDGYPIYYNRGVSGKLNRQSNTTDQGLRLLGGDWDQCAYGVGMDVTIKVSDSASYVDAAGVTHSAFQENLILLLAEAYFGFVVGDLDAFCKYTIVGGS